MSMVGELIFFLSLQIKYLKDGIFVNPGKHVNELSKHHKLNNAKQVSTPMASTTKLDQHDDGELVNEKSILRYDGFLIMFNC